MPFLESALLAYIDPGSGTLLLQIVVGGIVGSGVYFRNQLRSLFAWMRHKVSPAEK